MLFVLFQLGQDRFALDASRIVEVLPLVSLKRFPQAPRGVAGILIYRGQPVPALDLCELTIGRPAREQLSTRILIVPHSKPGGESQLIGLIAERATGTLRRDAKDFMDAGVKLSGAAFLGPILTDDQGVIQLLDAQKLLDEGGQQLLPTHFGEASHVSH